MAKCKHFQLPIANPGPCLKCETEKSGANRGPLANFAGGRDGWREGQTTSEYMRQMKEDSKHLPKDRQPQYAGPGSRWV